ncbi:MAG: serine/threonine protein kinase [Chloroflexus sp.]|uniref:serine/threonine protein kinase n=1 Tax=Chloroflexus sp. TaxID=1904827 RepID=UPI003C75AE10
MKYLQERARFVIARPLARTAQSVLYLAYDHLTDQPVVIKVLAPTRRGLPWPEAVRAFLHEIKMVLALQDIRGSDDGWPYFPRYITHGRSVKGYYYYVQSYIPGQTLAEILAAGRPSDAITIAYELCRTVRILHAHRIVHGDLHPQNIIVRRDGAVVLVDFGLSRYFYEQVPYLRDMGRPLFTPPEQIVGRPLDERSDLFALGLILAELLEVETLPPTTQRLIMHMQRPLIDERNVQLDDLIAELVMVEHLQQVQAAYRTLSCWLMVLVIVSTLIIALFYLAFFLY